jgi:hypothetical protein
MQIKDGWVAEAVDGTQYFYPEKPLINSTYSGWFAMRFMPLPYMFKRLNLGDDWVKSLREVVNGEVITPFEHDEVIEVWNHTFTTSVKRYFKRYGELGQIFCYPCGVSSITADDGCREVFWSNGRKRDIVRLQQKDGWVAEDKCGAQFFYLEKPEKIDDYWWEDSSAYLESVYEPLDLGSDWKHSLRQVVNGEVIAPFEHDEVIEVWNIEGTGTKRYFKRYGELGEIFCYPNGASSLTAEHPNELQWRYGRKNVK